LQTDELSNGCGYQQATLDKVTLQNSHDLVRGVPFDVLLT
jgi:hypothetical protein